MHIKYNIRGLSLTYRVILTGVIDYVKSVWNELLGLLVSSELTGFFWQGSGNGHNEESAKRIVSQMMAYFVSSPSTIIMTSG